MNPLGPKDCRFIEKRKKKNRVFIYAKKAAKGLGLHVQKSLDAEFKKRRS